MVALRSLPHPLMFDLADAGSPADREELVEDLLDEREEAIQDGDSDDADTYRRLVEALDGDTPTADDAEFE